MALVGLEPFVQGGVDWTVHDDLSEPGNAFYPPNNDLEMPTSNAGKRILQEWFFPSGGPEGKLGVRDPEGPSFRE